MIDEKDTLRYYEYHRIKNKVKDRIFLFIIGFQLCIIMALIIFKWGNYETIKKTDKRNNNRNVS